MAKVLEMTHHRQHRQQGFDQHAAVPLGAFAGMKVDWLPIMLGEMPISEHHHRIGNAINQVLETTAIIDIGSVTVPEEVRFLPEELRSIVWIYPQ